MAPAELKKLRNKQRKARKRAELEKEKQTAAQEKREQHIKAKLQQDGEVDGIKEEELVPEKLARVEDPLEQAIRFLKPLQSLAADRIETHLLAFEIYWRKDKLLLMLQSLKKACKTDFAHPRAHSQLVQFYMKVSEKTNLPEPVSTVLRQEMAKIYGTKNAFQLNEEFLEKHSSSLFHVLEGARMMYYLNKESQKEALKLVTGFNNMMEGVSIDSCTDVLNALRRGDFGPCDEEITQFVAKCHELYPYATVFKNCPAQPNKDDQTVTELATNGSPDGPLTNHVDCITKEE